MKRNKSVDAIRGLAMLMVVLGHTISGVTTGYERTFVFQVIWTLQMPLFIIISGYVTRYGRPVETRVALWRFVRKRTLAYMLPWVVWTIGVRGVVFGQSNYLDLKHLLWHMDSGYWFLATIWTICMIFGVADYLCHVLGHTESKQARVVWRVLACGAGMAILAAAGASLGLGFFAIKLTLYYFPFYLAGYIYGQTQDAFNQTRYYSNVCTAGVALCTVLWLYGINRFDFYGSADVSGFIALRFFVSLMGSVAIIGLFTACKSQMGGVFSLAGMRSLEIYTTHYLCLSLIRPTVLPGLSSMEGLTAVAVNYAITLTTLVVVIAMISKNRVLGKLLFFKQA